MSDKEEKKEGEEAPKKKSKKMLFIIIGVVLLLGGAAAFFLLGSKPEEAEHVEEVEKPKVFKTAKLDPFIVNLSEAKSFLKVVILLEYDEELVTKFTGGEGGGSGHGGGGSGGGEAPEGGFPPALMEKEARMKDKIIAVLSSKTPADVLNAAGKNALKDELLEGINEVLEFPEPVIVGLYFTEFIVQ
jgi:flagellar FliL protein